MGELASFWYVGSLNTGGVSGYGSREHRTGGRGGEGKGVEVPHLLGRPGKVFDEK
jgi:hypothetical protein